MRDKEFKMGHLDGECLRAIKNHRMPGRFRRRVPGPEFVAHERLDLRDFVRQERGRIAASDDDGADLPFLEAAVRCAPTAYFPHMGETLPFVREYIEKLGVPVEESWECDFPAKARFFFHDKPVEWVRVVGVRVVRA